MPDIGTWLGQHWDSAEHAVSEEFRWFGEAAENLVHGHPYPDGTQAPADQPVNLKAAEAAQPEENQMGFITDVRNDLATAAHDVAAKAADFEQVVLPAVSSKLTALENNPVVDSLLSAVHVPPEALQAAVALIDKLEELYNPATPDAPAPDAPAQPVAAAPAGQ